MSLEPEPDVAVLARTTPRARRSQPSTAPLVFEVAGDSAHQDREIKGPIYARAGIPSTSSSTSATRGPTRLTSLAGRTLSGSASPVVSTGPPSTW